MILRRILLVAQCLVLAMLSVPIAAAGQQAEQTRQGGAVKSQVDELLARMSLAEKIGQLNLINVGEQGISPEVRDQVINGQVGAVLNVVDVNIVNELQRIAVEESRVGIPLLNGRDVIHGFNTVMPIPLGQAASWNPELVQRATRIAAREAAAAGVNWTFAPMIDVTRDPRWGRIAESFGEDPLLHSRLGAAMVRGFQGDNLAAADTIAACAKHFAGYGASESGRDYNSTFIPESELRNVYLPPFQAVIDAGVATVMTSFSDLNGIPASGNQFLLRQVLRQEWGFEGFVVSDWASVEQLTVHGLTADDREAALAAIKAGVNMEMATTTYQQHLPDLVAESQISESEIDQLVAPILALKISLGLFDRPYTELQGLAPELSEALEISKQLALQSLVLLENRDQTLPLDSKQLQRVAVIGPMADDGYEQMGTWVFDGDPSRSQTPLQAIRSMLGDTVEINYVRAMETTRSRPDTGFKAAVEAATAADVTLLFLGEEAILSGEAHSRTNIDLPGMQQELVHALAKTGKPLVAVVMAGRPLTLGNIVDEVDALLYAWHPGSMGGPAIADVLFGNESPSGKLPITFPRVVGQVPIYYAHRMTGKPPTEDSILRIDEIPARMPQTSAGFVSHHLDVHFTPQYVFGYGLSYGEFDYTDLELSSDTLVQGELLEIIVTLTNRGAREAEEVVQLYIRDLAGSITRPVRELKDFRRVLLQPGESRRLKFTLRDSDLAFYDSAMEYKSEPGEFMLWVGGNSSAELQSRFRLLP